MSLHDSSLSLILSNLQLVIQNLSSFETEIAGVFSEQAIFLQTFKSHCDYDSLYRRCSKIQGFVEKLCYSVRSLTEPSILQLTSIQEEQKDTVEEYDDKQEEEEENQLVMVLDGSIGAGKTSLLSFIESDAELSELIETVKEPLEYWENLLPEYYNNPEKLGMMIQNVVMFAHTINAQKHLKCDERKDECKGKKEKTSSCYKKKRVLLLERDPQSCNLFSACMNLLPFERDAIHRLSQLLTTSGVFIIPPLFRRIYLKADPSSCLDRIRERNRDGEDLIPLEYLEKLDNAHEIYFESIEKDKKIVIDSTKKTREEVNKTFKEIIIKLVKEVKEQEETTPRDSYGC